MSCTVLCLLKTYLKPLIRLKYGFNSCDKGLTQGMVTTAAAVMSTMQIVEYHVMYNTTTDQTHLKQTAIVVGGKVTSKKKKRVPLQLQVLPKHTVQVLLDQSHNRHLVLLPRQSHAVSVLEQAGFIVLKYVKMGSPRSISYGGAEVLILLQQQRVYSRPDAIE